MQDVLRDFVIWLIQFFAVSVALFVAARLWTLHRRKQREASTPKKNGHSKHQSTLADRSLSWHADPVLARMMRVVVILTVSVVGGTYLVASQVSGWFPWTIWSFAIVVGWGVCTLWLVRVRRQHMEVAELRRFANALELAALQVGESEGSQSEVAERWPFLSERDCRRLPEALQQECLLYTSPTNLAPEKLRSFADSVHLETSQQALSQARRVSQWAKYPLLVGVIPSLCFLLVAPMTEWMLDRITTISPMDNSSQNPKKPGASDKRTGETNLPTNTVPVSPVRQIHEQK
ncbi:MAG: hypothetical protein KDA84_07685 [Planctomycetaceae bacterium]|nr:hypothetical protein [Planctomycetaceae bacterium]